MFFTIGMIALYEQPALDARVVGQIAPNQSVPVEESPVQQDGWLWYRVKGPDDIWVPQQSADGSQLLLEWRGLGGPPARRATQQMAAVLQPAAPASTPAQAPQSVPAAESTTQPAATDPNARIKLSAFEITSLFEGGGYAAYQNYDRGIISYGLFQFTLAAGSLGSVIARYLNASTSETAEGLRAYRQRIIDRDETLRDDEQLKTLLKEAAQEQAMKDAQNEIATTGYWDRVQSLSLEPRGIETPLGQAMMFDVGIQYGIYHSLLTMAEENLGVPEKSKVGDNGITEQQLITEVAAIRKRGLYAQAERDDLPGLKPRADFWVNLIEAGDWDLQGDDNGNIKLKGRDVQVRQPAGLAAASRTTSSEPSQASTAQVSVTPAIAQPQFSAQMDQPAPTLADLTRSLQGLGEAVTQPTEVSLEPQAAVETPIIETSEPVDDEAPTPAQPASSGRVLYITPTTNSVNLRSRPTTNSSVIGTAKRGEILEVIESYEDGFDKVAEQNQWLHVRTSTGEACYGAAWLFRVAQPDEMAEQQPAQTPVDEVDAQAETSSRDEIEREPVDDEVPTPAQPASSGRVLYITPTTNSVNLRSRPTTNSSVIGTAKRGEILEVIESYEDGFDKVAEQNQWLHVRTSTGEACYGAAWLFRVAQPDEMAEQQPVQTPVDAIDVQADTPSPDEMAEQQPVQTPVDAIDVHADTPSPDEMAEQQPAQTPVDEVDVQADTPSPGEMAEQQPAQTPVDEVDVQADTPSPDEMAEQQPAQTSVDEVDVQADTPSPDEIVEQESTLSSVDVIEADSSSVEVDDDEQPDLQFVDDDPDVDEYDMSQFVDDAVSERVLYLSPRQSSIRLRETPSKGDTIGGIGIDEVVEVLEPYDEALSKVGMRGEWINVRTAAGLEGYAAAWLIDAIDADLDGHVDDVSQPAAQAVDSDAAPDDPAAMTEDDPESADDMPPLMLQPKGSNIRLRSAPVSGETIGGIRRGEMIETAEPPDEAAAKIGVRDQWVKVRTAGGLEGFAAAWLLELVDDAGVLLSVESGAAIEPEVADMPQQLYLTPRSSNVRMRVSPVDGDTIGGIRRGEIVEVIDPLDEATAKIGVRGQWVKVQTRSGQQGFVASWLVEVSEQPPPVIDEPEAEMEDQPSPDVPAVDDVMPLAETPVLDVMSQTVTDVEEADDEPPVLQPVADVIDDVPPDEDATPVAEVPVLEVTSQVVAEMEHPIDVPAAESAPPAEPEQVIAAQIESAPSASVEITSTANSVNLRAQPSLNAGVVGTVQRGEVVTVIGDASAANKIGVSDEWVEIQTQSGHAGFVAAWLFEVVESSAPSSVDLVADDDVGESQPVHLTPTVKNLRLRATPVDGQTLGGVREGEIIESLDASSEVVGKIGQRGQWVGVRTAAGQEGYVAAWLVRIYDAAPDDPAPDETQSQITDDLDESDDAPSELSTGIDDSAAEDTPAPDVDHSSVDSAPPARSEQTIAAPPPLTGGPVTTPLPTDQPITGGQIPTAPVMPGTAVAPNMPPVAEAPPQPDASPAPEVEDDPSPALAPDTHIVGVNLDVRHPLGTPDPSRLGSMGWVRFGYDVSAGTGSTDLDAAFNHYAPVLENYTTTGIKVILVCTHQTFGEGQGYNWEQMNSEKWRDLSDKFAAVMGRIAAQFAGKGLVHAYQIWNEQDAHAGARASVPLPPDEYGYMLTKTIPAIRAADAEVKIITGGHASGPGTGPPYAKKTMAAMPDDIRPDGVALHPYGRGDMRSDPKYRHYGDIDESVKAYVAVMPDKPVWITEWGVLDAPDEPPEAIAKYAAEFIARLQSVHAGKIASALWFAWGQGMDNGYGLVDESDQPRGSFTDTYCNL